VITAIEELLGQYPAPNHLRMRTPLDVLHHWKSA
jgi:hypothetical protein